MSATAPSRLLVVDDEPDLRTLYELTLLREGYSVDSAATVEEAWQRLNEAPYHAVITDVRLPDGTGLELLRRLEVAGRAEKTIVITAHGSAENQVRALQAGAFDYLTKPVDLRQFRSVVASALGRPVGTAPAATSDGRIAGKPASATLSPPGLRRLVGRSAAMRHVRDLIDRVARGMAPLMLQGESGTGKELVARAVHEVSARAAMPFIAVNCGAIPEQLLEAEFFGYRKGAFTGATEDRAGFFQAAQGGTLFLDEIGDLPLAMQSKLLRAIQERSVRAIGAVNEVPVNVRIISATHKDLSVEVQEGRFRQDLYYRLNVIQLRLPPLRERLDDLPELCQAVLARIARDAGVSPAPRLSPQALQRLSNVSFPGNVRELENLLHRAVTLVAGDVLGPDDLGLDDGPEPTDAGPAASGGQAAAEAAELTPSAAQSAEPALPTAAGVPAPEPVHEPLPSDLVAYLDDVERAVLVRALALHRFNRTAAGASLGLSLRQMRYRMARLQIAEGDADPA